MPQLCPTSVLSTRLASQLPGFGLSLEGSSMAGQGDGDGDEHLMLLIRLTRQQQTNNKYNQSPRIVFWDSKRGFEVCASQLQRALPGCFELTGVDVESEINGTCSQKSPTQTL